MWVLDIWTLDLLLSHLLSPVLQNHLIGFRILRVSVKAVLESIDQGREDPPCMWVVLSHRLETLDRIKGKKEKTRPFSEPPLLTSCLSWGEGLPSLTCSMVFYWNTWGQENMDQTPWIREQNWMLPPLACSFRYFGHSSGQVTDTGALEHVSSSHSLVSARCQLLPRFMCKLGWELPKDVFKQGWDRCVALGSLSISSLRGR